jgi:lipopolysaccharide/colanic/teichoic acid biosynthesis glycosyltransferase
MLKRLFDIIASIIGLLLLSPFFVFIIIWIKSTSKGGVFYFQQRMGKGNFPFKLFKFRTMYIDADKKGLITVGMRDSRITPTGYFLRKYKLDELPQLLNVLNGSMSLVGPRPEVEKYTKLYNEIQLKVLSVKPGITDLASIKYSNENEILEKFDDPEKGYIEQVMPDKLKLNLEYIQKQSFWFDIKIIFATLFKIAI